jgi:hypothetical protein
MSPVMAVPILSIQRRHSVVQQTNGLFTLVSKTNGTVVQRDLTWDEAYVELERQDGGDGAQEFLDRARRSVIKLDLSA